MEEALQAEQVTVTDHDTEMQEPETMDTNE